MFKGLGAWIAQYDYFVIAVTPDCTADGVQGGCTATEVCVNPGQENAYCGM